MVSTSRFISDFPLLGGNHREKHMEQQFQKSLRPPISKAQEATGHTSQFRPKA